MQLAAMWHPGGEAGKSLGEDGCHARGASYSAYGFREGLTGICKGYNKDAIGLYGLGC